ncbi:MAG: carboxypeptidase regulatory-like domain-containing protein [Acidobacteriota bacterium]|nr:carboxypeptidase regulatory-like domain-containing protein [Acidobacteriota bacterium]
MNRVVRTFLLSLCASACIFAQRDLGTITGTVTDGTGGVIGNAAVTITERATGQVYELTTNSAGEYTRAALKPSTYDITVSAAGFKKATQKDIVLNAGERTAANIALTIGDVGQTVEVTAAAPLLQTESTQVGAALNSKLLTDVPLGGQRNFAYLARLTPGVVPAEPGARDANNGGFSANGVRANGQNNFLLNGVDNNVNTIDFLNQTSYAVGPSIEAISEISVITNGYNAEYGRAAGGVINVNLKSGTNQLHGTLFELLQNKALDANTWTNNSAGKSIGPFVQNQFGVTAGGPILKNKLFIFGDYQGTRIAASGGSVPGLGRSGFITIPTDAMKNGDFSSLLQGNGQIGTDPNGNPIIKGAIYDPKSTVFDGKGVPISRTPFPGNIIPKNRWDPSFAKILSLYPSTNQQIVTGTQPSRDFYYVSPGGQTTDQGDGRVDYRLSDKDSLFGSLSWSNTGKTSGSPFPGPIDGADFNGAQETDLARNAQISYSRVWSANVLSETRVGFTRLVTSRLGANPTTDLFTQFGIGGYNPTHAAANNGGLPQISIAGYQQTGANDWIPTKEFNNVWDFIQNVAINKSSHSFKLGAEFRQVKFPFFQVPDPHGNIGYSNNQTAFPSNAKSSNGSNLDSQTGDAIASALLGQIDSGNISTTNFVSSQKVAYAGYIQDDWKVTPKLTLNLGVRYELWSPIDERFGRQANFDLQTLTLNIPKGRNQNDPLPPNFATAFPTVKVIRGQAPSTLIPWDKTDIGPRFGLAYQAFNKTVIRLGYGIFYGGEENQGGSPNRGEGVPFNETVNLQRANGVSNYIGVSDPNCPGCNYFPGGLTGGYPTNVFALPAPISFRGVQSDFRNPLVHKWNVIVQRELPGNMSLEVGYEGNHQAHQLVLWGADPCPNLGYVNNPALSCENTRIILPPAGGASIGSGLSTTSTFGFGNYAAGSVKLEKRYSSGLQFLTSYVWSHALANSGTPLSGSSNLGAPNPLDFSSEYSSASWDIRHSFTTAFNYDIPFGKGKRFGGNLNRAVDIVAGNWHANGILTLRTGPPYTIAGTSCQGNWNRCVPDLVSGGNPNAAPSAGRSPGTNGQWFDIGAFAIAAPLTGGNLGLQSNTAPPTRTMDFSVFKDFAFTERFRLQFRGEAFNIANTPQFSTPDASLGDSKLAGGNGNFGKVTSSIAGTERHVQFSLRLQF